MAKYVVGAKTVAAPQSSVQALQTTQPVQRLWQHLNLQALQRMQQVTPGCKDCGCCSKTQTEFNSLDWACRACRYWLLWMAVVASVQHIPAHLSKRHQSDEWFVTRANRTRHIQIDRVTNYGQMLNSNRVQQPGLVLLCTAVELC
eukprot:2266214-Rhodomonas_salina.3